MTSSSTNTPQNPDDLGFITATLSTDELFKSISVRFIPGGSAYHIDAVNASQPGPVDIIDLTLPENAELKEYEFGAPPGPDSVNASLSRRGWPDRGAYPYAAYSGKLVLTKVDHLKPSFEGTFYFTGKNSQGEEISLSDGKFEITGR